MGRLSIIYRIIKNDNAVIDKLKRFYKILRNMTKTLKERRTTIEDFEVTIPPQCNRNLTTIFRKKKPFNQPCET